MKKYISIVSLLLILVPSIALASWWNPLTWFNNWTFQKQEKVQNEEMQKTSEKKINELQKELDELKNKQKDSTSETTKDINGVKKIIPSIDNSSAIKLKAEKDALMVSQKLEEQARIDAELKAKAEQDTLNQQRLEEQEKIDRQNQAIIKAEEEKLDALNEINLKITNLNAKYLKDKAEMELNKQGMSSAGLNSTLNDLHNKYINDYNLLTVEYQRIKYSD